MNEILTTGFIYIGTYITTKYVVNYAMNKATEKAIEGTLHVSKKVVNAAIDNLIKPENNHDLNCDYLDYILIEIDSNKTIKVINVIEIETNNQNGYIHENYQNKID